jgi:hypothetical protein
VERLISECGCFPYEDQDLWTAAGRYPTAIPNAEAFIRTVLCNPNYNLLEKYSFPDFGTDREETQDRGLGLGETDSEHIFARIGFACADCRFYVTSGGYFGLGPPVTSPGDIISVFFGGRTPFLIRPQDDSFEIVAETYLQGLMNGEALTELEKGDLKAETFPLR